MRKFLLVCTTLAALISLIQLSRSEDSKQLFKGKLKNTIANKPHP